MIKVADPIKKGGWFILITGGIFYCGAIQAKTSVRLNEVLPNPSGKEKEKEFIEIYNPSSQSVNLSGWFIKYVRHYIYKGKERSLLKVSAIKEDAQKYIVKPHSYLILRRKDTHCRKRQDFNGKKFDKYICGMFNLYNSGKIKIQLLNPRKKPVSQLQYQVDSRKQRWLEDVSYNYFSSGWRWSRYITPNRKNRTDKFPQVEFKVPSKAYVNVYASFSVKVKKSNQIQKVIWDFGDGHRSYKLTTKHKYTHKGKYKVRLTLFNGSEIQEKTFSLPVTKFPHYKVRVVKIVPNPKGKDINKEYLLLRNYGRHQVNLKGWSLATGSRREHLVNHPVFKKFIIPARSSRRLTGKYAHIVLANRQTALELRYPDGMVAQRVRYKYKNGKKNIPEGAVYWKRKGDRWRWKIKKIEKVETTDKKKTATTQKESVTVPINNHPILSREKTTVKTQAVFPNLEDNLAVRRSENYPKISSDRNELAKKDVDSHARVKGAEKIQTFFSSFNFFPADKASVKALILTKEITTKDYWEIRDNYIYFTPQIIKLNYWQKWRKRLPDSFKIFNL